MTRAFAIAMLVPLCLAGCRGGSEDAEERRLETVDVEPSISIDIEDDPTEVERAPALVGVLPSGFPEDMPLYLPASLIDFGTGDGGRFVSLLTPHAQARVERELIEQARGAGWTAAGSGGTRELSKGGLRLRLRIEDGNPGTLYHFEY